jgi:hypothetical protein
MGVQLCRRDIVHDQRRILYLGVRRRQRLEVDCREFVLFRGMSGVFGPHVGESTFLSSENDCVMFVAKTRPVAPKRISVERLCGELRFCQSSFSTSDGFFVTRMWHPP